MVFSQTLFNLDDFKNKTKTKLFQSARDQLYKEINNKSYGFLKDLYKYIFLLTPMEHAEY